MNPTEEKKSPILSRIEPINHVSNGLLNLTIAIVLTVIYILAGSVATAILNYTTPSEGLGIIALILAVISIGSFIFSFVSLILAIYDFSLGGKPK